MLFYKLLLYVHCIFHFKLTIEVDCYLLQIEWDNYGPQVCFKATFYMETAWLYFSSNKNNIMFESASVLSYNYIISNKKYIYLSLAYSIELGARSCNKFMCKFVSVFYNFVIVFTKTLL